MMCLEQSSRLLAHVALALSVAAGCGLVNAQAWPSKPVRMIVPFGPGGGSDILARMLSRKFHESMGQPFVVENRTGAGGNIGSEAVARSAHDGYTLLFTSSPLAVNASLYRHLNFDPVRDLQPISRVSSTPLVLAVHPSVPARSVRELVDLARKRKGGLNAASAGSGATSHLSIEMMKQLTGVDMAHIPYKGGGPAVTALLSGEVDLFFATSLAAKRYLDSGKIRGLAVTSLKRSNAFPELPTLNSFYQGFEMELWYGMFFPAGTPREIVARMNAEVGNALKSPDVGALIVREGGDPTTSTPEEMTAYFRQEIDKYARIIKAANIQAD